MVQNEYIKQLYENEEKSLRELYGWGTYSH